MEITSVKLLQGLPFFRLSPLTESEVESRSEQGEDLESDFETDPEQAEAESEVLPKPAPLSGPGYAILIAFACFFAWLFAQQLLNPGEADADNPGFIRGINAISLLAVPFLLAFFPLYAHLRKIPVYEEFTEGAKEGFQVAVRIIPFLAAILIAIGMFRSAGGIDMISYGLGPVLAWIHFPSELLPMVIMRPLSGSGTMGIFTELVATHGPDHLISRTAATIFGSTETTFYVVTVYFGAVAIRKTRHAIAAGLLADLTGVIAAVIICRMVFA